MDDDQPRPMVALSVHTLLCLSLMVFMLFWPAYQGQLLPARYSCIVASLWRRRFHDSVETLLWLVLAYTFVVLADSKAGRRRSESPLDFGAGVASDGATDAFMAGEATCLNGTGHIQVLGVQFLEWLPPLPIQAFLAAPPATCLDACEAFLREQAWAQPDLHRQGLVPTVVWAAGGALAVLAAARMSSLVVRAGEILSVMGGGSDAAAVWGGQVRSSLSCVSWAQLVIALARALLFVSGSLRPHELGLTHILLVCVVSFILELAWYPLAVLPAYYFRTLVGVVRDLFEFFAAFLRATLALVFGVLEAMLKRIILDFNMELSLPSSTSCGDDLCAICLSPLHVEAAELRGVAARARSAATAVARLRPGFRARCAHGVYRSALVRFGGCQHAFHRSCFLECASTASYNVGCCPTCRTDFVRLEWRCHPPRWLQSLLTVARERVDVDVACRALASAIAAGAWVALRRSGRFSVQHMEATEEAVGA